jgi:hypothetical protein
MCCYRDSDFNRVLAPEGEILFFTRAKKSIQKKPARMPLASCALTFLSGVAGRDFLSLQQRAASLPRPFGLFPIKPPVLGAAYGIGTYLWHSVID